MSSSFRAELEEKKSFLVARLTYYHSISSTRLIEAKCAEFDEEIARIQARKDQLLKDHTEAPAKVASLTMAIMSLSNALDHAETLGKVARLKRQIRELEELEKEQRASFESKQKRA